MMMIRIVRLCMSSTAASQQSNNFAVDGAVPQNWSHQVFVGMLLSPSQEVTERFPTGLSAG